MIKRILIIPVVLLCLATLLNHSVASENIQEIHGKQNRIITSGLAEVTIQPDKVKVLLGVETLSDTINRAREENASTIKKVIEALNSLNIKDILIEDPHYNVSLIKENRYEAEKMGHLPKILGYNVLQNFVVIIKDKNISMLSKNAGLVIDAGLNNGANIVQAVTFSKEDTAEDERNVLSLAVKDAILNARTIAETAGVSIKSYMVIDTIWMPASGYIIERDTLLRQYSEKVSVPTTLHAGDITLTARVKIECAIE